MTASWSMLLACKLCHFQRWDLRFERVLRVSCAALCRLDLRWGLQARASSGWRRVLGIADQGGGAVPWGLLVGASRAASVFLGFVPASVALCDGDCCWAGAAVPWGSASRARRVCGVCGAVLWGLLLGRSCRRRRVIRIGEQGVVWVAPCH